MTLPTEVQRFVNWESYVEKVYELGNSIEQSGLQFDHIVCIARGALLVGCLLAERLHLPLATIYARSYTTNCSKEELVISEHIAMLADKLGKRVLLVDDLVDTGSTLEKVKEHLRVKYGIEEVATGVIWEKSGTSFKPDFIAEAVNKEWIVQPFDRKAKRGSEDAAGLMENYAQRVHKLGSSIQQSGLPFDHIVCVAQGALLMGCLLSEDLDLPLATIYAHADKSGEEVVISEHVAMVANKLGERVLLVADSADAEAILVKVKNHLQEKYAVKDVTTRVIWEKGEVPIRLFA